MAGGGNAQVATKISRDKGHNIGAATIIRDSIEQPQSRKRKGVGGRAFDVWVSFFSFIFCISGGAFSGYDGIFVELAQLGSLQIHRITFFTSLPVHVRIRVLLFVVPPKCSF